MSDDMGTFTRAEIMAARDNDPLWPKRDAPPARAAPPASAAPAHRLCEICDTNIDGAHPRAKTCVSEKCKRELTNRRLRRIRRNREATKAAEDKSGAQSDPQPQADPAPDAAGEHPPAIARLLAASPNPVDDTEDQQDPDDDDRLGRIEAAAEAFLAACVAERNAQARRITAQRRLAEAISKDQDA